MGIIIGRQREQNILQRLRRTDRSEFLAVYGRRRVGKTYLIKEALQNDFTFSHTGLAPISDDEEETAYSLRDQLKHFMRSLTMHGYKGTKTPGSWLDAFYMLEDLLKEKYDGQRQVVFIDELPWMDTPKSNLVRAIDAFWNSWCNGRNILFIVCGSAASWMLENIIHQTGGLYGRTTCDIKLSPFTLAETEQYFNLLDAQMSRYDITQAYMALGGIPYYMNFWQSDMSLVQNFDYLFFARNAKLRGEFNKLFRSLFAKPEKFVNTIRFLSWRHGGFSRAEISEATGIGTGKGLSSMLEALEASDFIQLYQPLGNTKREMRYRLIDPFCWFHLYFMEKGKITDPNYWQNNHMSPTLSTWRGIAFEEICLLHIRQIKHAMGIEGIATTESNWIQHGCGDKEGVQIDLVISRSDNVVSLCEMKFYSDDYRLDKAEDEKLRHRKTAAMDFLNKKQSLKTVLVTTFGIVNNMYSGAFSQTITLEDLFCK